MNYLRLFKSRFALLLKGQQYGVSLGWLSKSQERIYTTLEEAIGADARLSPEMLNFIPEGIEKYKETVKTKSGKVTNTNWNSEANLSVFLYSYIRVFKPKVVVETGVANGITTNVIMSALEITGGELHSFDILAASSGVYTGKGKWHFYLLSKQKAATQIKSHLGEIVKPELWLHDSNHGSLWQEFEYKLAINSLKIGGLLISDDIDASTAWGYLSKQFFINPRAIFDKRKMIGYTFKK